MPDVYSDIYWTTEFEITVADLDRIASHVEETSQAHDLTSLARRVVQGRLRFGPEHSDPALPSWAKDASVRLWDPAGEWRLGNQTIIWTWSFDRHRHEVMVGEIAQLGPALAHVEVEDSYKRVRKFQRAPAGSHEAIAWHQKVRSGIEEMRRGPSLEERAESVVLEYGERIISQLFEALHADERFVSLGSRWYLRQLTVPPLKQQVAGLAWAILHLEAPRPTEALIPLLEPPLPEGDGGLFGLFLTLSARPDLFTNVNPGERPSWTLAGPPPGRFTPQHAAYDPSTYEIVCLPGQPSDESVVQRLWELDLLRAVI